MPLREVPLGEAALQMGLTTEALRQRLRRGKTLQGVKRGGEWYVWIDDRPLDEQPVIRPDANSHDQPANGHDRPAVNANGHDQTRPVARDESRPDEAEGATRELVEHLRSEVGFLRSTVQVRDDELRRQAEQHAIERGQWQQRLQEALFALAQSRALPAASPTTTTDFPAGGKIQTERPLPWWRRWLAWVRA